MAQVSVLLLDTLENLGKEEFKKFKWHLKDRTNIPKYQLEEAERHETVDLLVQHYPREAFDKTIEILNEIKRMDLVQQLSQNDVGGEYIGTLHI